MSGSWPASMLAALAASVGRPQWWVLSLAAFLVRGGILVVLLPLISLPSVPALATLLAPTIEAVYLSRQSLEDALIGAAIVSAIGIGLVLAALAGSWLDNALARDAEGADDLDLRPARACPSAWHSLGIRLAAHLPTLIAAAYGVVRIVVATYQELLSPGDATVPIALRVIGRAPDAILIAVVVWVLGEVVGGIAVRRAAEGESGPHALRGAARELLRLRGVATLLVTDALVAAAILLLIVAVGRASDHVRAYLLAGADPVSLGAALLLLVTSWLLSLAVLGAALAWRATAWTVEAAPRRPLEATTAPAAEGAATGEAHAG